MLVSQTSMYALRAMAHLASQEPDRYVPSAELSAQVGIPRHYVSKVLRRLVVAGLCEGTRGHRGGFRLARPADEIAFEELRIVPGGVDDQGRAGAEGDVWLDVFARRVWRDVGGTRVGDCVGRCVDFCRDIHDIRQPGVWDRRTSGDAPDQPRDRGDAIAVVHAPLTGGCRPSRSSVPPSAALHQPRRYRHR